MKSWLKLALFLLVCPVIVAWAPVETRAGGYDACTESVAVIEVPSCSIKNFISYDSNNSTGGDHRVCIPGNAGFIIDVLQNSKDSAVPIDFIQAGSCNRYRWIDEYDHGSVLRYITGNPPYTGYIENQVT